MLTMLMLLVVTLIGVWLQRHNYVSKNTKSLLFKYVYYVATPCAVIYALITRHFNSYSEYGRFLAINSVIYLFIFVVLYSYLKNRKIRFNIAGVIAFCSNAPNSVFLGFPLILTFFYNGTFIFAVLLGTIMDAVLNFIRLSLLGKYVKTRNKSHKHKLLLVKSFVNSFLIALLIGLGVVYLRLEVSKNLLNLIGHIGQSATYTALLMLGISVGRLKIVKKDYEELTAIALVKLVAMPLMVLIFSLIFNLPESAVNAGVFIAAMPTAIFSLIVAGNFKLDEHLAASAVLITTTISTITLPLWYIILHTI